MSFLSNRRVQFLVFGSLFLVCMLYMVVIYQNSHLTRPVARHPVFPSEEGRADNDTGGTVPGDPENGVRVLRHAYHFYTIYKARHQAFPSSLSEVIDDIERDPKAYHVSNPMEAYDLLINPDNQYADDMHSNKPRRMIAFSTEYRRPDGTARFGSKNAETRDVLEFSDFYVHSNLRQFSGRRTTVNPVGFYQVIWEDGEIQQIPYDKVRYAFRQTPQGRQQSIAFPGQAGVPNDALSYDEYWTKHAHWQVAPHGVAGGKGVSYNGNSYR